MLYRAGGSVSVVMTRITVAASDTVTRYQCLRVPQDQVTDVEMWGTDSTKETMIKLSSDYHSISFSDHLK